MGSGGPSTRAIVEAADITRAKGPKRVGPYAVPKSMCSTASATLSTWFKIKGMSYSISSACATSNHCIGAAYEQIQLGKQDLMFAGGCEELDWTLSVQFDAMGAMSTQYNETPQRASRAYDKNRDGFVISGGAGVLVLEDSNAPRRAAQKSTPRSPAMARPPTASTWSPLRAKARRAACGIALATVKPKIDYINPHATSTPVGDAQGDRSAARSFRVGRKMPADFGDQIA